MLDRAREIERLPGIKDVALFPVQPWLDVEGLSSSVVITSSPTSPAAEAARQLAETWYADRHRWQTGLRPWPEIHAALRQRRPKPWILVDTADATTGGSSGASPEAVRQLWSLRDDLPGDVLLWVVDPAAYAAAAQGATTFDLGTPAFPLTASVRGLHEGSFQARGRSYTGQTFNVGPSAVLQAGRLFIVVSSRGALVADPAFYTCVGLDPDTALAVHVKSLMGWKAGYEADSDRALIFDGPGATSLNFARLPYTGERRNLFPIDPLATPNPTPWQSN
jgi:microcystin degradation protein MlrC